MYSSSQTNDIDTIYVRLIWTRINLTKLDLIRHIITYHHRIMILILYIYIDI